MPLQITANNSQNSQGTSQTKLPSFKRDQLNTDSVEVVDLAHDGAVVAYSDVAPRDYRTLHNIHAKVQKDKAIRLPKQKPQFSYASGDNPNLPLFQENSQSRNGEFDSDSDPDDFPSFSKISKIAQDDHNVSGACHVDLTTHEKIASITSNYDGSMDSLEEAMIGLDDSIKLRSPTSNVNSSFGNQVLNSAAFNAKPEGREVCSTSLMGDTYKRARSTTPDGSPIKYRRIKNTDTVRKKGSLHDDSVIKNQSSALEAEPELATQDENHLLSQPSWVKDMDPSFIDSLKDFVDFID